MNTFSQLELFEAIKEAQIPVGATYLSDVLKIPQATIGRALRKAEQEKFVEQVGNKGRRLTDKGFDYIDKQRVLQIKKTAARSLIDLSSTGSKERLLEVLHVRLILETDAVELACKNATENDFAELDKNLLEYIREIRYGGGAKEQDLKIHLMIAKISGNSVIWQILKLILTEDDAYTRFSLIADNLGNANICLDQHEEIVQAIKARDANGAKKAMEKHLTKVINDIKSI